MSLTCPICSKENPDLQEFCSLCGTLLTTSAEPAKELSPEDVDAMLSTSTPALPPPNTTVEEGSTLSAVGERSMKKGREGDSVPSAIEPAPPLPVQPVPLPVAPTETKPVVPVLAEPIKTEAVKPLPPPKPTSRRWSPRCLGIGCLGALLLLFVGVPLMYFFIIRPPIERALIRQVEDHVNETYAISIYSGDAQIVALSQNKANTLLEPLWGEKFTLKEGQIAFHQDSLTFTASWFTIPIEINADLRVDGNGGLIVKTLTMNWLARLLFTPESLAAAITHYVNDEILRPKNFFLLAFQVTDGDLLLAYRSR